MKQEERPSARTMKAGEKKGGRTKTEEGRCERNIN